MKDNLIVLAQSLEQPRIVKRINQKAKEYESVHVYGFTRNVHSVQNFEVLNHNENVEIRIVGQLKNKNYLGRVNLFLKLIFLIYGCFGFKKKSIYVFGLDLRILSFFIINSKVYYEISDIIWLYSSKSKRKILSVLDKYLVGRSHRVIYTTKSFYESYYSNSIDESKIIIEENRLETYGRVKPVDLILSDKVRIAYIGAFRYIGIIENLIKSVSENKDIILNFYGATHGGGLLQIIQTATKDFSNVFYHGPFKNPDDLMSIYGENNLNFVVYDNSKENERVAMPNKFYESGFFNIPLVCATKTYVGERVLDQEMGWIIDTDFNSISDFINKISVTEIRECHERIKELDKSQFII